MNILYNDMNGYEFCFHCTLTKAAKIIDTHVYTKNMYTQCQSCRAPITGKCKNKKLELKPFVQAHAHMHASIIIDTLRQLHNNGTVFYYFNVICELEHTSLIVYRTLYEVLYDKQKQ